MTTPARGLASSQSFRPVLFAAGLAVLVVAVTPPLDGAAARYALFEALQFSLLAIVVPALVCLGAPWRLLGLGAPLERLQAWREQRTRLRDAAIFVVPSLVLDIVWRSSGLVAAVARHPYLVLVEAVTLIPAGIAVWAELVGSSPLAPRLPPMSRIPVAAVSMWMIWIIAFVTGLANSDAYGVFSSIPHRALSVPADQQLTAAVMWLTAAVAYIPVAFSNLMAFLRKDAAEAPR